jgi:ATP-dependent RNA helicase DDX56/DBP9
MEVAEELTFSSFHLDPRLLKALEKHGYVHPTLIQSKTIPLILEGKDILAKARTGSGKTLAYLLPLLQLLLKDIKQSSHGIRALILVPTQDLCEQLNNVLKKLTMYCSQDLRWTWLNSQKQPLLLELSDVIISTPSRFLSYLKAGDGRSRSHVLVWL